MAITTSRLTPLALLAMSSSFDLPSGLITALSKSNSTSAAKVTFSATGLGLGFSGSGLGFAGSGSGARGLGAGGGAGLGAGGGAGFGSGCAGSVAQPAASASATSSIHTLLIIESPLFSYPKSLLRSRVCVTLEGILPYLPTSVQAAGRRSLVILKSAIDHARLAVDP